MRATTVGLVVVLCVVGGGCGRPKTFDSVRVVRLQPPIVLAAPEPRAPSAIGAANLALAVRSEDQQRFILVMATASESRTPPHSEVVVSAVDWPCVAEAETGSDWSMHGATYSTAYGMVNDIIYEYATPDVQQRVFSGTASAAEQTDIADRFAADHGTGGWGARTREKCGL